MKVARLLLLTTLTLLLFAAALVAPAIGQAHSILVYSSEGQAPPSISAGSFEYFRASAGDDVDLEYKHTDIIEGDDFSTYDCVILPGRRFFEPSDYFSTDTEAVLKTYVENGGLVLALGGCDTSIQTNLAMNHLAGALGSGLSIYPDGLGMYDGAYPYTTNIDTSLFTQDVNWIGYASSSKIVVSGGGQSLIRDADVESACILAAEKIGDGWFLLSGDNAIFSDDVATDDGFGPVADFFELYDNDVLAYNIVHWDSIWQEAAAGVFACYERYQGWLDDGDLEGVGKTPTAARGKARALGNMLEQAQAYVQAWDWEAALGQLRAALGKCDGLQHPPDFVQGTAREELQELIEYSIDVMD